MTLIGCRCTWGDPFSRAVLITRTLLFKIYFTKFQYVQYNSRKRLANIKAVIAQGLHLLPFRTEKLNLATPMVLPTRESRKRPPYRRSSHFEDSSFFCKRALPTLLRRWAATLQRSIQRKLTPLFLWGRTDPLPSSRQKVINLLAARTPQGGGEVTTEGAEVHRIKLPSVGGGTGITEFNECRRISLRSNDWQKRNIKRIRERRKKNV